MPPGDRWALAERRLYLCTPDRPDLQRFVEACVAGGVDVVQLREKLLDDRALAARAELVQQVCRHQGVPFILNDRPDLAAAIGADGVHVGQDDPAPVEARRLMGDEAVIGLSTHRAEELDRAVREAVPVQYLSAGPVSPTPTKPGRPGTGLGYVALAVERSPWPVWVTGGVAPATVGALAAAGARHFVAVRWLTDSAKPERAARELRWAIDDAVERCAGNPRAAGVPPRGSRPSGRR